MKTNNTFAYIIFGLIAIGILGGIFSDPASFLIPVLVFGIIFLLYKFPPSRWRRSKPTSSTRFQKGKTRNANFRVIPGSKDSSDGPPKFH